jgi:hypothetical protein
MKHQSQLAAEQERRGWRLNSPLPPDWTNWDRQYALRCAERYEALARELCRRKRVDPEHIAKVLHAAMEARRLAAT